MAVKQEDEKSRISTDLVRKLSNNKAQMRTIYLVGENSVNLQVSLKYHFDMGSFLTLDPPSIFISLLRQISYLTKRSQVIPSVCALIIFTSCLYLI